MTGIAKGITSNTYIGNISNNNKIVNCKQYILISNNIDYLHYD